MDEIKMFQKDTGWWAWPAFRTVKDADGTEHKMIDHEKTLVCNIYKLPKGWFIDENGEIWMDESTTVSAVHVDMDKEGKFYINEAVFAPDDTFGDHPTYERRYLELVEGNVPISDELMEDSYYAERVHG